MYIRFHYDQNGEKHLKLGTKKIYHKKPKSKTIILQPKLLPWSTSTFTMAIDLTKAFDMINHTKLISVLTLSPLSNNTKHWLSA